MKSHVPNPHNHAGSGVQDEANVMHLLDLPHKILTHHEVEGLAPLVLHELGHIRPFSLTKAGYFIDNPDFGCLRGVAGYDKEECSKHKDDVWADPHVFGQDMQDASFHKELLQYADKSLRINGNDAVSTADIAALAKMFGMHNPSFFTWPMKHGNQGLLIFESDRLVHARHKDLLHKAAALLSLC